MFVFQFGGEDSSHEEVTQNKIRSVVQIDQYFGPKQELLRTV